RFSDRYWTRYIDGHPIRSPLTKQNVVDHRGLPQTAFTSQQHLQEQLRHTRLTREQPRSSHSTTDQRLNQVYQSHDTAHAQNRARKLVLVGSAGVLVV
ncbi:hypothetical protein LTR94_018991, partial [Friedmanniomyces endolithicus]